MLYELWNVVKELGCIIMKNRVCDILGIEKPVIQGAMAWLTDARLVAAVSEAGGAGVLGLNAGSQEVTTDREETANRLREQIRAVKKATSKPFGVNTFMGVELDPFSADTYKVVIEEQVPFVLMLPYGNDNYGNGTGFNMELIQKLKDAGIKIVYRPMTPTVRGMKEAEKFADILICTGSESGGHNTEYNISLLSVFPYIRKAIKAPLMAAGGICEELAAKAVAAMGAEGVYVGTRFMATSECRIHEAVKQKMIEAEASELIKVPSMPGYIHLMPNTIGRTIQKMYKDGATGPEINQYYSTHGGFKLGHIDGDVENGILNFSEAIDNITEIKTCKEVVNELSAPFME